MRFAPFVPSLYLLQEFSLYSVNLIFCLRRLFRLAGSFLWVAPRHAALSVLVVSLLFAAGCAADTDLETAGQVEADTEPPALESTPPQAASPDETPVPLEELPDTPEHVDPPAIYADGAAADLEPEERDGLYDEPPPMVIDPARHYYATLKTQRGDIRIQLFADRAPLTVNNFVFLANEGFYNDTIFHRVIDGFMAQAGDPAGTGSGGPGYMFEDEIHPGLVFDQAGLLAMANRGPDTNGSQFFLTFGPAEWLDFRHTIFGKVIEGEDVLARISLRDPANQPDTPGDMLYTVLIKEREESVLPTPTPMPPTPTPTPTPTPFAPTELDMGARPLADLPLSERVNYFNQPPETVIEPGETYTATMLTSEGELTVALYADTHPVAVNNFIVLAHLGFYDETPIALVRPEDSIIFGVPDNNPLNDAGYKFPAEMGVGGAPDFGSMAYIPFEQLEDGTMLSSSSQILIALIQPAPEFSEQLSFFGKVVEGVELLEELQMDDTIETILIYDEAGPLTPRAPVDEPAPDTGSDNGTDDDEVLDASDAGD